MNFWLRWKHRQEYGGFTLYSPWWVSAETQEGGSGKILFICAAIKADSSDAAQEVVQKAYEHPPKDIEWSFVEERQDDWMPFTERFPRAPWMQWS